VAPRTTTTTRTAKRVAKTAATTQQATDRSIVRRYLENLASTRGQRSRRTPAAIQDRLAAIDTLLPSASTLSRLQLVQERIELQSDLATANNAAAVYDLEAEFVQVASRYAERRGISYAAWREVGVPAAVLRTAGITRHP
jgi:hypothetical protein